MDFILDSLSDISEPIVDYIKLRVDQEKLIYFTKWGLYLLKVFIAVYMIGSAVWNIYDNQSYFYMVNENGIFKIITNVIKLGLALFMLNQFNLKLNDLALLKKEKEEGVKRDLGTAGVVGSNVVGAGTLGGAQADTEDLDGFSGWYDMFKDEMAVINEA